MSQIRTPDMIGQPSDQQDGNEHLKHMLVGAIHALALQVVEAEVAFQHGEKAFRKSVQCSRVCLCETVRYFV